jgi:hypothetical protein
MSGARKVHPSGPAQDRNAQRRATARAVRRFQRMTAGELWALADGMSSIGPAYVVRLAAELRATEARAGSMARELLALLGRMEARPAGLDGLYQSDLYFRDVDAAAGHVRGGRVFCLGSDVRQVLDAVALAVVRAGQRRGATRRGGKA